LKFLTEVRLLEELEKAKSTLDKARLDEKIDFLNEYLEKIAPNI